MHQRGRRRAPTTDARASRKVAPTGYRDSGELRAIPHRAITEARQRRYGRASRRMGRHSSPEPGASVARSGAQTLRCSAPVSTRRWRRSHSPSAAQGDYLAATSRRSLCHRRGGLHRGLAAGAARQSSTRKLRSPPPGTWCVARGRSGQGSSPHVSVLWHNHRRAPPEREHGELRLRRAGAAARDPTWVMADGRLRLLCQFLMFGRT